MIAASSFVALTTLTEVLGQCLEYVYRLPGSTRFPTHQDPITPLDLEMLLIEWEDSLHDTLRRRIIRGTDLIAPGTANLRLCYLSVKLQIRRNQLDWDRHAQDIDDVYSHHYIQVRKASEEVVDFVRELEETHLHDFWIPVNAYSLTSATTFLLRSALRSRGQMPNRPLNLARTMIEVLQSHRDRYDWDLADHCLSNCRELVVRMEDELEGPGTHEGLDDGVFAGHGGLAGELSALDGLLPELASISGCTDLLR
jgi:hypothetical protein